MGRIKNRNESIKCHDESKFQLSYATTTKNVTINANDVSASMDVSTIKNENGRTYAQSIILKNTIITRGIKLAKLSSNGRSILKC